MDRLPGELLLQIALFLEPEDIVHLQCISHRFLSLTRDHKLWKRICFDNSRAEAARRRKELMDAQSPSLAALAQAVSALPGGSPLAVHDASQPNAEMQKHRIASRERVRAMANWDPSYPDEQINFYQEYIHRHAPISLSWFQSVSAETSGEEKELREATGVGLYFDNGEDTANRLVAPMDDGSICVWDASTRERGEEDNGLGRLVARSPWGLLTSQSNDNTGMSIEQSKAMMTDTGAVECVSIDSRQQKGYFAVQNVLSEVDLNTLQVTSRERYPFPITSLSEARHPTPVTVGTNLTIHLHDSRVQHNTPPSPPSSVRCELIGGTPPKNDFHRLFTGDPVHASSHATLSEQGPLSILHLPDREWDGNGDIWVGGRFTSLLNYDRRFFPRLRGTVHSGARISCLSSVPHAFIPRELNLMRDASLSLQDVRAAKEIPGTTLLAAGEYKGKGSLELYGLSPWPSYTTLSTDPCSARYRSRSLQNRQTASGSKLLSVAAHGPKIVYSDGDGNLKWVERDGFTPIRQFNIETHSASPVTENPSLLSTIPASWTGDIVQKILPTTPISASTTSSSRSPSPSPSQSPFLSSPDDDPTSLPLHQSNLIIWTGDGRLGLVGFGRQKQTSFSAEEFEARAESGEERARRENERRYGEGMRRALEAQARDVRFVRGLGM
ncbi:hypothetical protein K402DRAFT_357174, partial [Aulographum hederae CBS 113979]